jgi:peptide deformylase
MQLTKRTLKLCLKPMTDINIQRVALLSQTLLAFMKESGGIGLAANQVGLRDRCFVMSVDQQDWVCINPEIVSSDNDYIEFNEGCLSFLGDSCIIRRPNTIKVRFLDAQGNWQEKTLIGLASRCFQHELDHLNGITMWDRYKEQDAEQSRN